MSRRDMLSKLPGTAPAGEQEQLSNRKPCPDPGCCRRKGPAVQETHFRASRPVREASGF